jgi:hypothetical protein
VFGSFSWSANIFGRKHWLILPPGEETKLKDKLGNLPFSITTEILQQNNVKHFNLIQESGETLFVPSKWFHQVHNLDDSVSVNHNWFNACNIEIIVDNLFNHFKDVEKEISDCKEMENFDDHCQLMLKSSFGMNFQDLVDILKHISDKRIKSLRDKTIDKFSIDENHDLRIILQVFERLKENNAIRKFDEIVEAIDEEIRKIKEVLVD